MSRLVSAWETGLVLQAWCLEERETKIKLKLKRDILRFESRGSKDARLKLEGGWTTRSKRILNVVSANDSCTG
jgi:hypothetical protein